MHHPALALVTREIRVTLRGRTLPMVLIACSVLLFIGAVVMIANVRAAAAGRTFLLAAANLQVVMITVIAAVLVAGSVSEEKETGGLDLLLMTGMTPFSLLAGIAGGRVVALLATLLVQLPFLALAFTAGGVFKGQIFAAFAVLASHAAFCTGLALWTALVTGSHGRAAAWMVGVNAFITLLAAAFGHPGAGPFGALAGIFNQPGSYSFPFGWCALYGGAGFLLFILSCLSLHWALAGAGAVRRETAQAKRRGRPDAGNAMFWKDYHFLYGGFRGVAMRMGLLAGGVAIALLGAHTRGARDDALVLVAFEAAFALSTTMIGFDLLYQSARMFRADILEGAQDSLRCVPVRARPFVGQKQKAFFLVQAPVLAVWLVAAVMCEPLPFPLTYVAAFFFLLVAYSFHIGIADLSLEAGWWSIPLGCIRIGGIWLLYFISLGFLFMFLGGFVLLAGMIIMALVFASLESQCITHLVLNYLATDPSERKQRTLLQQVTMFFRGDPACKPMRRTFTRTSTSPRDHGGVGARSTTAAARMPRKRNPPKPP